MYLYQLGKTPARPDSVKLKFGDYVDKSVVWPKLPAYFGHDTKIAYDNWAMLGNDTTGDCVWAGAAHETILWNVESGHPARFTTKAVLSDYSAVTGYNPADPSTDQGTDMQAAASYRLKTGILDDKGKRHKVAAYLEIKRGDLAEHLMACYLFSVVGIGFEFPQSAMDQFNAKEPWSQQGSSPIIGGHYVPLVAHHGNLIVVSWGRIQQMTVGFFQEYNDESISYVSTEALKGGVSLEGFNAAQLEADLKAISQVG